MDEFDMKDFEEELKRNRYPVARTDGAGQFIEVNKAYEELTGYTLAELKNLTYRDLTPEKWLVYENNKVIKDVFVNGEMSYDKEYIHKSGKVIPINAQVFLVHSEDEQEQGMWGIFTALR
ncbi:PAS domain-containing protein [Thalassotalea loyana]|nr:PAS domain-containing protein [Thalassotalea loyana]